MLAVHIFREEHRVAADCPARSRPPSLPACLRLAAEMAGRYSMQKRSVIAPADRTRSGRRLVGSRRRRRAIGRSAAGDGDPLASREGDRDAVYLTRGLTRAKEGPTRSGMTIHILTPGGGGGLRRGRTKTEKEVVHREPNAPTRACKDRLGDGTQCGSLVHACTFEAHCVLHASCRYIQYMYISGWVRVCVRSCTGLPVVPVSHFSATVRPTDRPMMGSDNPDPAYVVVPLAHSRKGMWIGLLILSEREWPFDILLARARVSCVSAVLCCAVVATRRWTKTGRDDDLGTPRPSQ